MGFKDKIKDILLKREGSRYKNLDFLKRNKVWIGVTFFAIAGYVWMFKCPGLDEAMCLKISLALTNIGSFLSGAGILPSDYREKFVQGKVDPNVN